MPALAVPDNLDGTVSSSSPSTMDHNDSRPERTASTIAAVLVVTAIVSALLGAVWYARRRLVLRQTRQHAADREAQRHAIQMMDLGFDGHHDHGHRPTTDDHRSVNSQESEWTKAIEGAWEPASVHAR